MNWSNLTQQLYADGVLADPQVVDTAPKHESGYGRWLSVLGAWVAALLLLGFIGALAGRLLQNDIFCVTTGSLLLITGVWMGRTGLSKNSVLFGQFAIIACVLGGILLGKVISDTGFETTGLFILAALCILCLLITHEQSQRQLFAVAGIAFLCLALAGQHVTFLAWLLSLAGVIYLCWQQDHWVIRKRGDLFNALILALSLGALLTPRMLSSSGRIFGFINLLDGEMAGYQRYLSSDLTWAFMGGLSALIVAVVGYRTGLRLLRYLALMAILGYGYMFYFSLGTTLLYKAFALFSTGIFLLLIRLWVSKKTHVASGSNSSTKNGINSDIKTGVTE
jgi:Domain of unknown function (DUF4401)